MNIKRYIEKQNIDQNLRDTTGAQKLKTKTMSQTHHIHHSASKKDGLVLDPTLTLPAAVNQKRQKLIKRASSYCEQTEGSQKKVKIRRATADDNLLRNKEDKLVFGSRSETNDPLKHQKRKRKSTDQRSSSTLQPFPKESSATTTSLTPKRKHKTSKIKSKVLHAHSFLNESDYDESADAMQKKKSSDEYNQKDIEHSIKYPAPGFLQFQVPIINIQQSTELENAELEKYSFESIMKRLHKSLLL